jgi:membrane protein involved in colicin uptake
MADNHDETTSLRPLYAARLAEDLKHNTEEQERIGSEVVALQEKLESLRHDHALLLTMQQALGAAGQAAEAASASAPTASVPRQAAPAAAQDAEPKKKARARKSTSSPKAESPVKAESSPKAESSVKATSSAKSASASKAAAASKPAPKPASKPTAKKASAPAAKKAPAAKQTPRNSDGPTLRDLVVGHLTREGEPRSALEVTDALTGSHPERGAKITVVRSTLEALVAKGQVRRSKQGKSVFYSTESVPAAADEKQPAAV